MQLVETLGSNFEKLDYNVCFQRLTTCVGGGSFVFIYDNTTRLRDTVIPQNKDTVAPLFEYKFPVDFKRFSGTNRKRLRQLRNDRCSGFNKPYAYEYSISICRFRPYTEAYSLSRLKIP